MKLSTLVYNYPTKSKNGFHSDEIHDLLKKFPDIKLEKFYNALKGITVMADEEGTIIYHCDILNALNCGIENRDLAIEEWD